jgi:hypothetical protein
MGQHSLAHVKVIFQGNNSHIEKHLLHGKEVSSQPAFSWKENLAAITY